MQEKKENKIQKKEKKMQEKEMKMQEKETIEKPDLVLLMILSKTRNCKNPKIFRQAWFQI